MFNGTLDTALYIDINTRMGLSVNENEYAVEIKAIENSIYNILSCPLGSRWMRPDFGSRLSYLLFESQTGDTSQFILMSCIQALQKWEERIIPEISRSSVTEIKDGFSVVIGYTVKDTNVFASTSLSAVRK